MEFRRYQRHTCQQPEDHHYVGSVTAD
jgi:hypothetical protein